MIYRKEIDFNLKPRAYFLDRNSKPIDTKEVLFFDTETAPKYEKLNEAPDDFQELWKGKADVLKKFSNDYSEDMTDEEVYDKGAALFPEYNRIVCVSIGRKLENNQISTVSFTGDHIKGDVDQIEHWIIKSAFAFIAKQLKKGVKYISGANTNTFDIPLLLKKGFRYGYHIDPKFYFQGSKPWEDANRDVQKEWKGFSSLRDARLESICYFLNIESPKDKMSGKNVAKYFYKGKIKEIAEYCEKDVVSTIKIFEKLQSLQMIY